MLFNPALNPHSLFEIYKGLAILEQFFHLCQNSHVYEFLFFIKHVHGVDFAVKTLTISTVVRRVNSNAPGRRMNPSFGQHAVMPRISTASPARGEG